MKGLCLLWLGLDL